MILIDTSVWIDHAKGRAPHLDELLRMNVVAQHPYVIGELLLGVVRSRTELTIRLGKLLHARVARDEDVFQLIEDGALGGTGIGFVDAHLLASTKLSLNGRIWTHDRRLAAQADRLGLAYPVKPSRTPPATA